MTPGFLKALSQAVNHFRNWRKGDPQSATQAGRKYLFWILLGGTVTLWILYQSGIAAPIDFAKFTVGLVLVEIFEFGTLLRLGMAVDPFVGGVLGTIGVSALAKFFRDLGGISAAVSYFFSIW